jgi:hypothetical protein
LVIGLLSLIPAYTTEPEIIIKEVVVEVPVVEIREVVVEKIEYVDVIEYVYGDIAEVTGSNPVSPTIH